MIYPFSLETALLLVGLALILGHGWALLQARGAQEALRRFPRSRAWGTALIIVAVVWGWLLIKNIDLGEFTNWRTRLLILIPIAGYLAWRYVEEFLAVRALGMIALLAAEPLLEAAWLRPESLRLFLVVLAYAWVVAGMFWVGMPYTFRDQAAWVTARPERWRAVAIAGIAYGAVLLAITLTLRPHLPA